MSKGGHIFLCGFMGSGKSTHGKKLAMALKRPFEDLDKYIQKKENKTIDFIFRHEGESAFREMETNCLKDLVMSKENLVVALGGGTVCFNNNIELIKQNGILVYIEMPVKALTERLKKSRQSRPVLKNATGEELETLIDTKLEERKRFYQQADVTVDGINLRIPDLIKLLQIH